MVSNIHLPAEEIKKPKGFFFLRIRPPGGRTIIQHVVALCQEKLFRDFAQNIYPKINNLCATLLLQTLTGCDIIISSRGDKN